MKRKIETISWALKIAWKINKKVFLGWTVLSAALAVLPSISVLFHKKILTMLTDFLSNGNVLFPSILPYVILFGITLTLIGLSSRINNDLIYMMMYDHYYFGMEELMSDSVQKAELRELLKNEMNAEYNFSVFRCGSLCDFASGLCMLISRFISIISILVVAFFTSRIIFLFSFFYSVCVFLLNFYFVEKTRFDSYENRKLTRLIKYYENISDHSGIAKEMRVFQNQDKVLAQWENTYEQREKLEVKRIAAAEKRNFIGGLGYYIFLGIIILYCVAQLRQGQILASTVLVLFTLCINVYTAVSGIARDVQRFDYGLASLERQRDFLNKIEKQRPDGPLSLKDCRSENEEVVFEIRDLCFSYQDGNDIIRNLNLKIKKGETIAIVGKNGSGKSTLVKLLVGLFIPQKGEFFFKGVPVQQNREYVRRKTAIFFQDFYTFHRTLGINVGFGDIENIDNEDSVVISLKKAGAESLYQGLPDGIHTLLEKKVDKSGRVFSGGEKQKIGIARAYMGDRDVYIFDEPASALDPIAEMEQFMQIKETLKNKTAILISHRVGFARMADRILVMDNGRIVEDGTHDELIIKNGLYADFYNQQAEWYERNDKQYEI